MLTYAEIVIKECRETDQAGYFYIVRVFILLTLFQVDQILGRCLAEDERKRVPQRQVSSVIPALQKKLSCTYRICTHNGRG